jgi:hypothetical protein
MGFPLCRFIERVDSVENVLDDNNSDNEGSDSDSDWIRGDLDSSSILYTIGDTERDDDSIGDAVLLIL